MSDRTFDRLVEEYDAETRCNLCRQPVTARGCACRLAKLYGDRQAEVLAWWNSLPAPVRDGLTKSPHSGKKFRPLPSVMSALTTERTKAGLHDVPMDPDDPQGLSVGTGERMSAYAQLGIDPTKAKWRKGDQGPERRPYRQKPGVNPASAGGVGGRATRPSRTVSR